MSKIIKNGGYLVVEILVAVSIITISILAAMAVAQKSIYVSRQTLHATQAAFLLEEGAEAARIIRDGAWSNISNLAANINYYPTFSGSTWTLSQTGNTVGIFTRTVNVSDVCRNTSTDNISSLAPCGGSTYLDAGTKFITLTVSWPEGGQTVTKTLQFYLMNIFS